MMLCIQWSVVDDITKAEIEKQSMGGEMGFWLLVRSHHLL